MNEKRLNKAIADSGYCSRRKADELIFAGKISVNGIVELNPARRITRNDKISANGKELLGLNNAKYYFMLYKTIHTVCTVSDPEGRSTILDLLPAHLRQIRLFPVGRLDYFSEGLLLLTNDGDFANHLMHPRYHLEKRYLVTIRGKVSEKTLSIMRSGMTLDDDGTPLLPVQVNMNPTFKGNTQLEMILRQGINRQIRRMCQQLGLTILKLKRIAQGTLSLGDLKPGQVRPLNETELAKLKKACGL